MYIHRLSKHHNQLKIFIMNAVLNLGKYLFAVPFAIFGLFHFMGANDMAAMAPGGVAAVYGTGVALLAASVSMLIGKMDKLASVLLALMLILFALIIHLPGASENPMEMGNVMKNLAMAGGALMYAKTMAKDDSVIG